MSFSSTVGVSIGTTNAYVAVNGQMVANADGHRNTEAMVSSEGDIGYSALSKWVRSPEKMLDRNDSEQAPAFWDGLLNALLETVKSAVGDELDTCLCNILIEPTDNRKVVETIAQKIFKNVQILTSENQLLLSKRYTRPDTPATICVLKLGGNSCKLSKLSYDPVTQLFSSRESSRIDIGGKHGIEKIVEFSSVEFKRKNRACQEGIAGRGKRKLLKAANQVMQTLSNSQQATLYVEAVWEGIDMNSKISRSRFEDQVRPLFNEILEKLGDMTGVDDLLLFGGASNIPLFQKMLKQKFENVTTLDGGETMALTASKLIDRLPAQNSQNPTISLKTAPSEISLGSHTLIPKGAPIPLARHGSFQIDYPENAESVKMALEVKDHGALTEELDFEKCSEAVQKSAKNPTGKENLVFYYVAYCDSGLKVRLESSKNTYNFAF